MEIHCHNIRDYSPDPKHHRVDDTPYGGGKGMVMQPEPIYRCYLDIIRQSQSLPHVIYLSPQGQVFTEQKALGPRGITSTFSSSAAITRGSTSGCSHGLSMRKSQSGTMS